MKWKVKKLGEVLCKTETVDPRKMPDSTFQYIDVSSICNQEYKIKESSNIQGKDAPSRARKLIKAGDILFAMIRPTLKRIAQVPEKYNGQVCSTGYYVLRPKSTLNNRFLFYFLFTDSFISKMEKLQRGTSYPAVTNKDIQEQYILVPPLEEQKRIVRILDESFEAIALAEANTKKNLANARELFDSYLNKVFTEKGDRWEEKNLKDISLEFGRGKSKHRPRNDKKLYGGKYPFVQTGDIRNSNHILTTYSQTYNDLGLAQSKLWKKGTVCITIAANIAETAILDFDACMPDSLIGLLVDENKANNMFVEYMLQAFKLILQAKGKGSAQDNINMATFKDLLFPFPDLETQKSVVKNLDILSDETQKLEGIYQRKLEALAELKQSILQKAFTGQLTQ